MDLKIVLGFFVLLGLFSLLSPTEREKLVQRNKEDWLIDSLNLLIQGALIPLLQVACTFIILKKYFSSYQGSLELGIVGSFLLNFVVVDYIYYWNHRVFHRKKLWPIHRLHHSSKKIDVFSTSRNTWFASFFFVYFWLNTLFIFLVDRPDAYVVSMALTAGFDLVRHTGFHNLFGPFHRWISLILITPRAHAWHHSQEIEHVNFGANLSLWDRMHGTYLASLVSPQRYGVNEKLNLKKEFLKPTGSDEYVT